MLTSHQLCALLVLPLVTSKIIKRSDGFEAHIQKRDEYCAVELTTQAGDGVCEGDWLQNAYQNGTGLSECAPVTGECAGVFSAASNDDGQCWVILYLNYDCTGGYNEYECVQTGETFAVDFNSVFVQCD